MTEQIQVKFPDGNVKAFDFGVTPEEIAASISPGLKKQHLPLESMVNFTI